MTTYVNQSQLVNDPANRITSFYAAESEFGSESQAKPWLKQWPPNPWDIQMQGRPFFDMHIGLSPSGSGLELPSALREHIKRLQSLEYGWDGDEAEPINKNAIKQAAALLHALWVERPALKEPRVLPTFDGSVQIEWHDPDRTLELGFVGNAWIVLGVEIIPGKTIKRQTARIENDEHVAVVLFYDWFSLRRAGRSAWPSK